MKRTKYVVGGALVLGLAAGAWLSDFLKGFGGADGVGIGTDGLTGVQTHVGAPARPDLGVSSDQLVSTKSNLPAAPADPDSLKVLIKDRNYFWMNGSELEPTTLDHIVTQVKGAAEDEDGIRLRIYREGSARVTAVIALQEALETAEVPKGAVYLSPDAAQ